jgi:hypothetical protein
VALLYTALRTNVPSDIVARGTRGWIRTPVIGSRQVTIFSSERGERVIDTPLVASGRAYEAATAVSCLRKGKLESETMPLDETLCVMR